MISVTQFLNEKMDGILRMERDNEDKVHLFHVNDSWSAVEKSAYFLSQMVACEVITLLAKGHEEAPDGQIVLASVSTERLKGAENEYSTLWHGDDYLVLKPRNIPTHYNEWHQENIVDDIDDEDFEE